MKHAIARRRLLMTKNLITMLVMAVVIIVAVFSWFSFTKTVTADNIVVKAVSTEIDIAPCIKTYNNDYSQVLTDGPGVFGSSVEFNGPYQLTKDCTGDGVDLIVPEFNVTKDFKSVKRIGKEVNENLEPANAVSNASSNLTKLQHPDQDAPEYQFLEFEFYVRSKNKDLNLSGESQLLARTEVNDSALSTYTSNKESAYGHFNVDGLVGAMRVSLIGEGCTTVNQVWSGNEITRTESTRRDSQKQILWVPRPDVYLNVSEGDSITDWSLITGVTSGGAHGSETYKHSYYKRKASGSGVELVANDHDSRTKVSSGMLDGKKVLGENINISDFTYSDDLHPISLVVDKNDTSVLDDYYVTKYKMNIWIEGTDSEARRAMDGGEFDITLDFL